MLVELFLYVLVLWTPKDGVLTANCWPDTSTMNRKEVKYFSSMKKCQEYAEKHYVFDNTKYLVTCEEQKKAK